MTFVPDSYTRAEHAITEITQVISSVVSEKTRYIKRLNAVEETLQNLSAAAPTGWQDAIAYITSQAAANPEDDQWKDLKGRADKIVGDFKALRTQVGNINTAIENA